MLHKKMEVNGIQYRCSSAIGTPLENETPLQYIRRVGYEIDRIEALLERHITWYTHKNPNAGECPICAICTVVRGLCRDYERMLGQDGDVLVEPIDSSQGSSREDREAINTPSPVLDNQE